MISTVCTTAERTTQVAPMDFSQTSNRAGAPLPLIPRRSSSSSSRTMHVPSHYAPPATFSPSTHIPANFVVQPPTPPENEKRPGSIQVESNDTESSSSSFSDGTRPTIAPRAKRVRGYKMLAMCPPENSTPTPAVFKAKGDPSSHNHLHGAEECSGHSASFVTDTTSDEETPRASNSQIPKSSKGNIFRLHLGPIQARPVSESSVDLKAEQFSPEVRDPPATAPIGGKLLRKKSGEPVKSSLKSSKRPVRGSLAVIIGSSSSKSEPSTPTHSKAVHFDQQLEYVKLFLAEQKPLAVSRDGSPTDTSGTESDFPSFIYGKSEDGTRNYLVMQVTNMPAVIRKGADVVLEELKLSQDTTCILGRVRVRNLAFEKWLAVRFTFDLWQTTSEVTGKYVESLENGKFDRFSFCIRLNDIKHRIEEKTLLFALRYQVAGREIWDNNGSQNYRATFSRVNAKQGAAESGKEEVAGRKAMIDLRTRLEQVVKGREGKDGADFFTTPISRRVTSVSNPPVLTANMSPETRYDFSASWRSPWKAELSVPPQRSRMNTHPSNSVPWPQRSPVSATRDTHSVTPVFKKHVNPPGSPRDVQDIGILSLAQVDRDSVDLPFNIPGRGTRNHQRGYFDMSPPIALGLKKTPPGTPVPGPGWDRTLSHFQTTNRAHSFPPTKSAHLMSSTDNNMDSPAWLPVRYRTVSRDLGCGSGESTPSTTTSISSPSPSPIDSLHFGTDLNVPLNPDSRSNDYCQFLNRFCFYTGSDSLGLSAEIIPRSHSVSSVEDFLSTPKPPPFMQGPHQPHSHSRSPSFDDVLHVSGSLTPTLGGFASLGPRPPSAIAS